MDSEVLDSIKHHEWYLINGGMNIARLKTLGYYVDHVSGEKFFVHGAEVDRMVEFYTFQIEDRARIILSLKDSLIEERVSDSSEYVMEP